MSEPFLSEIRMVSFSYPPRGWAPCNGQLLPINQNQALFALLGTMYGGNGQTTFALPDLRGRTPIHKGPAYALGQSAGQEHHTLTINEIPAHVHSVQATTADADQKSPAGALPAHCPEEAYASSSNVAALNAQTAIGATGGSQPHPNMQPYLTLNFIIALQGIFPSQT